jgi:hypothetical protein
MPTLRHQSRLPCHGTGAAWWGDQQRPVAATLEESTVMPVAVSNQHTPVAVLEPGWRGNEFMIATVPDIDTAALDPEERMSADETEALQLSRHRHTLQYAFYRVPHHNKKFDAHGVHPSDLNDLADLAKSPFTAKMTSARRIPPACSLCL